MFHNQFLVSEIAQLRKFALRLTKNVADSDDLLQSTLLRAMENREKFAEGTNLLHWSSRIMFNLFVSSYRRQKKYGSQYDPEPIIDKLYVEANQENHVDVSLVGDVMKELSSAHREILILVCVQGHDYAETAKMLGVPLGTVRSRLSRAREELGNRLRGHDRKLRPATARRAPLAHRPEPLYATGA